jgi:hypothetical protein
MKTIGGDWPIHATEAHAINCCASETCYFGPKNIGVMAVAIPELRFRDVEWRGIPPYTMGRFQ